MKKLTCLMLISLTVAGCTHTARITNAKKFTPVTAKPARPVTVGFAPVANDRLITAAIKELKADSSLADAKEDYKPGSSFRPDYVCQLSRDTKFKASGQNFFITFPGFIVFTHAMLGYKYTADITTQSSLLDAESRPVSTNAIHTPLEFRHCSFARGSAAGCFGWLLPGWGAAAVIPGAIFAGSYDKRATAEFMEKAEQTYARFVSSKVLEQINQAQGQRVLTGAAVSEPGTLQLADETAMPEAASENEYAVYIMEVKGNEIGLPQVSVKELPESVRATMNQMSRTGLSADRAGMENMLLALGASAGEIFGKVDQAQVFTQTGDAFVKLHQVTPQE